MHRSWIAAVASVALGLHAVSACSSGAEPEAPADASPGDGGAAASETGSGADAGGGDDRGPTYHYCAPHGCTDAEMKPFLDCYEAAAKAQLEKCYGPKYKTRDFTGGLCAEFGACDQACACDGTCLSKCARPADDCVACLEGLLPLAGNCTVPACAAPATDAGIMTCAELLRCCERIVDVAKKAQCIGTHDANAPFDDSCNGAYPQFAPYCP